MSNFTIEDYKNAIKAKYKEEAEGEYSNYLSSPTPANLRKLCVKRFQTNNNREDLNGFESFFDFPFDKDKRNLFGSDEMNKLESVKRFLLGVTEKPNDDTIQLAAILVDLRPRPFNEFIKQQEPENQKLIDELRGTNDLKEGSSEMLIEKEETDISIDAEINLPPYEEEPVQINERMDIQPFTGAGEEQTKITSKKLLYVAIAAGVVGLVVLFNFVFSQKECMQWSNDHYELVDCDLKIESFGMANQIELIDKSALNLKKVEVCDTTQFFDKNGDAIIWYAKTANGIDFFNGHGRHPENNRSLRPVTKYIIGKYVKK
ncbi:hypothetical protein [Flavobacterium sp. DG2-3]|uniref:hypothetical protein n=1 Tax=Flavobacterium sp. DG2-3 TaxID=3068317 RepID=UPI00273DAD65|nr:hypothetical protein [Flavobacterium sp. DG2-3]MDP5199473.1 hypothetical protein [Flavobacterium sp. DG2-3]